MQRPEVPKYEPSEQNAAQQRPRADQRHLETRLLRRRRSVQNDTGAQQLHVRKLLRQIVSDGGQIGVEACLKVGRKGALCQLIKQHRIVPICCLHHQRVAVRARRAGRAQLQHPVAEKPEGVVAPVECAAREELVSERQGALGLCRRVGFVDPA
ncbi:MAG: hypothetical protein FWC42_02615 [Proteobacteria bacterium]|nr:hypothetical protein [Pseudomonadota bacterium]